MLLLFAGWTILALFEREVGDKPFPYPWEALKSLFILRKGDISLFLHAGYSLLRWITGYVIASVTGIVLGIGMWRYPVFKQADLAVHIDDTVDSRYRLDSDCPDSVRSGQYIDDFHDCHDRTGTGCSQHTDGIQQIGPNLMLVSRMLELSRKKIVTRIILPGAAPSMINGLRVAAANGFRVLISAEMIAELQPVGYSLYQSRWTLDYASAFGSLLLIVVIGLIIEQLLFIPLRRGS